MKLNILLCLIFVVLLSTRLCSATRPLDNGQKPDGLDVDIGFGKGGMRFGLGTSDSPRLGIDIGSGGVDIAGPGLGIDIGRGGVDIGVGGNAGNIGSPGGYRGGADEGFHFGIWTGSPGGADERYGGYGSGVGGGYGSGYGHNYQGPDGDYVGGDGGGWGLTKEWNGIGSEKLKENSYSKPKSGTP